MSGFPAKTSSPSKKSRELVDIFSELGIEKVRLTGGEPLLRKDLPTLVSMLADNPRIADLAMTTNGILLSEQARGPL